MFPPSFFCDKKATKNWQSTRSALAVCLTKYKLKFFTTPPFFFDTPSNLRKFFFSPLSGLCSVYRSKAGKIPGGEEEEQQPCHNSHWLRGPTEEGGEDLPLGGPSRYVGYYDAASLYPASSK